MDYNLEGDIVDLADNVVDNIETAVEKLASAGAENFFISNSVDLRNVPYEISENRLEAAEVFTLRVNEKLPAVLENLEEELDINIIQFDHTGTTDKIVANPTRYGLKYLEIAAQPTWPEVKPVAENADDSYILYTSEYSSIEYTFVE